MKNTRRTDTNTPLDADDGVERPGPGKAPTAFRIWKAGDNTTDHGPTLFDSVAARTLMREQKTRGNRYSFDYNHGSLNPSAPPEAQRGAGSFMLEVRSGELWAVDCRWTSEAKAGIESGAWTSISPAYDIATDTGRVTSFLNCAVTNNPATWSATRLAASRGTEASSSSAREDTPPPGPVRWSGRAQVFGGVVAPPAEPTDERAITAARMGLGPRPKSGGGVTRAGRTQVFHTLTPDEARRQIAAKK